MFQVSVFIVINDFHSFSSSSAFDMMSIPYLLVGIFFSPLFLLAPSCRSLPSWLLLLQGLALVWGFVHSHCLRFSLPPAFLYFFVFLFICARRAYLHQWEGVSSSKLIAISGACCGGGGFLFFFVFLFAGSSLSLELVVVSIIFALFLFSFFPTLSFCSLVATATFFAVLHFFKEFIKVPEVSLSNETAFSNTANKSAILPLLYRNDHVVFTHCFLNNPSDCDHRFANSRLKKALICSSFCDRSYLCSEMIAT